MTICFPAIAPSARAALLVARPLMAQCPEADCGPISDNQHPSPFAERNAAGLHFQGSDT